MVIIELYGSNGKSIPYEIISATSYDSEKIKLLIHGTFHDFSKEEILELMLLIHGKCMSGVSIDRAKVFTEMYDKLDKIYSQKE